MKKQFLIVLIILVLVASLVLAACLPNEPFDNPSDQLGGGGTGDVANAADTTAIEATKSAIVNKSVFTETELETSEAGATKIAATTGVVEISKEGTYLFEGSYGGIKVTQKDLPLHFIFKNATFKNESGIAIDCQDKKVASLIITLADGTNNYVTNGGDDVNAIHVKGAALVINGKGSLTVKSGSKNAMKCSKEIKVVDATLSLEAANHAIACSALIAKNCTVKVTAAGKDGINAEYDGYDPEQSTFTDGGFVSLTGVNYTCSVDGDGIQANTVVYVNGGTYDITTKGNFVEKSNANMNEYGMSDSDFKFTKSGNTYQRIATDEPNRNRGTLYGLTQSCKGIKISEIETATDGNYLIAIDGGTFNINSTDDAIHGNSGNVVISGGSYTISTLDDGITSHALTKISGGNVNVTNCYEGIEGAFVEISGGTINIVASDDGINAASSDTRLDVHIIISGGDVTVNASGDGIDSNGSILISGGNVVVHGPTTGGDAGLDADRGIVVTGGTLFATCTLGMVETPSTNSTQCVVSYAQNSAITVGTKISLRDDSGNVLIEVEVKKNSCQSIIMSHPSLVKGSKYSIYSGNTKLETFTISSIITSIGVSTSNRGPGGFGGGGRR